MAGPDDTVLLYVGRFAPRKELIEALAGGVPVVGVRRGGVQSVVTDEVGGLAPPGVPAGFAAALEAARARDPASLGAALCPR